MSLADTILANPESAGYYRAAAGTLAQGGSPGATVEAAVLFLHCAEDVWAASQRTDADRDAERAMDAWIEQDVR